MPKKATDGPRPDPLRSQLAGLVAQPAPPPKPDPQPTPEQEEEIKPLPATPPPATRQRLRPTPKPKKPPSQRTDALIKHCKVMMSQAEVDRNSELAGVVTASFGSKVTPSQITRVLWSILAEAEDAIRAESKRAPKGLVVPSKGDHAGMALYEDAVAEFLSDAIRRA